MKQNKAVLIAKAIFAILLEIPWTIKQFGWLQNYPQVVRLLDQYDITVIFLAFAGAVIIIDIIRGLFH